MAIFNSYVSLLEGKYVWSFTRRPCLAGGKKKGSRVRKMRCHRPGDWTSNTSVSLASGKET